MAELIVGALLLIAAGFVHAYAPRNGAVTAGVLVLGVLGVLLVILGVVELADEAETEVEGLAPLLAARRR